MVTIIFSSDVLVSSALLNLVEKGFSRISEDEYSKIDRYWYESSVDTHMFLTIFEIVGGISLVVFLILILWNRSLQSQVKRKTTVVVESEQKLQEKPCNSKVLQTITKYSINSEIFIIVKEKCNDF